MNTKKEKGQTDTPETWRVNEYLEADKIAFTHQDDKIKARLMETIGVSLAQMENEMKSALEPIRAARHHPSCTDEKRTEWISCKGDCDTAARKGIQQEVASTAYVLRCLSHSLLNLEKDGKGKGKGKIMFDVTGSPSELTGRWEKDKDRFRLVSYGAPLDAKNGRLVMGFGPSASGKTFMTSTILNLLRENDPTLPPVFLSIDGDEYRGSSYTYNTVKEIAQTMCAEGFDNLMGAEWYSIRSLFDSSTTKSRITSFLQAQHIPIHLYIPTTLSKCGIRPCEGEYKKYKEITQDSQWIGLFIWQHREGKDCTFPDGYKCMGTTESGRARQKDNGKIYSSSAWGDSMKNGEAEFVKAPGGAYMIHNSGGKDNSMSVMVDYSKNITQEKTGIFSRDTKWLYFTNENILEMIGQFNWDALNLRTRIDRGKKKGGNEWEDLSPAFKQEYERLLRIQRDKQYGIYRALYPEKLEKSFDILGKLAPFLNNIFLKVSDENEERKVEVYYIRHGFSCANAKKKSTIVPVIHTQISDPQLHPTGIEQARALGKDLTNYIRDSGTIDQIFTSQLLRAIQTGLLLRAGVAEAAGAGAAAGAAAGAEASSSASSASSASSSASSASSSASAVAKDIKLIPLHVVPYLCEDGSSPDNTPVWVKDLADSADYKKIMEATGLVKIDPVWNSDDKSNLTDFAYGPLSQWLRDHSDKSRKTFRVFVVSHSSLIEKTFGVKLDNCQILPVTYSFTSDGFMLRNRLPTKKEQEDVKVLFPSPYSDKQYVSSKPFDKVCKEVEKGDLARLLNVPELIKEVEVKRAK